jgi:CelD/BcsL family acetyltransferase involved in cellulose biosynthesis
MSVRLEYPTSLEACRDEWETMAERSQNVFATWEWAASWWRRFGGSGQLLPVRCRTAGGATFAVLPLYVLRASGVRLARFIGHGPADELGPLCATEDRAEAGAALQVALEGAGAHVFIGEALRRDAEWSRLLSATVLGAEATPSLALSGRTWDDFLAARSSNFRQQVGRRERALRADGLRYRLCTDRARLDRDLDLLFALHRRRWPGGRSEFARREAFHRDFATRAFERGWLRLWFLELNGSAAAAWYGLRFGTVDRYYQAGRDPARDRAAVGFVLLAHSLREAMADGMREYSFGRGDEEYKGRFAADGSTVETVVLGRGITGRVALAAARQRQTRRLVGRILRG